MIVIYHTSDILCVLISNKLCDADMEHQHAKIFAFKLNQEGDERTFETGND